MQCGRATKPLAHRTTYASGVQCCEPITGQTPRPPRPPRWPSWRPAWWPWPYAPRPGRRRGGAGAHGCSCTQGCQWAGKRRVTQASNSLRGKRHVLCLLVLHASEHSELGLCGQRTRDGGSCHRQRRPLHLLLTGHCQPRTAGPEQGAKVPCSRGRPSASCGARRTCPGCP